jgi:hypothetical protein
MSPPVTASAWPLSLAWMAPYPPSLAASCTFWTFMPQRYSSSDDTHAMVARIAPMILELLGDGLPRSRHDIVAALAPHHARDEVVRTLMRLAVTGRLVEAERKYRLAPLPEPDVG